VSEELERVDLCIRWGAGKDRCIRHYDHAGDCQDATGVTTSSLTDWLLGRRQQPEFD
jgi:hypothetical protein